MSSIYLDNLIINEPNKVVYCVDMLRLSCLLTPVEFDNMVKAFRFEPNAKQYEQFGLDQFKFNLSYRDENCGFWFGYISNSESINGGSNLMNVNNRHNFTLEFNPNKCKDNKFLLFVLGNMHNIKLVSCDLACDIPCSIVDLDFIPINKSHKVTFDTPDGITYYFGKGDKRIKIYDKTKESNLDFDLTRIEMSVKINKLLTDIKSIDFSSLVFPLVSIKEYQVNLEDLNIDSTLKAVLFAVDNGYPVSFLSRRYQEKVKDYKIKKSPIEIVGANFNKTLFKYLCFYFPFVNDYI